MLDRPVIKSNAEDILAVANTQVPFTLTTSCMEIYQQAPKSLAFYTCIKALQAFLARAKFEGILQPSTQLCGTILQQVQQSGLLQHLADMMTAAADELARMPAVASGMQTADVMSTSSDAAASSSSSSTRTNNTHRGHSSMTQMTALDHADHLLALLAHVGSMISNPRHLLSTVPAAAYTAALRLINTVLQHASAVLAQVQEGRLEEHRGLPQQQHQKLQPVDTAWQPMVESLFLSKCRILSQLSVIIPDRPVDEEMLREVPQVQVLLLSPDLLPALAVMVAKPALALAAEQAESSSSSSSGRTRTRSGGSSIWRPAKQLQLELSPAQLQLCSVLGVSGHTLLWAAGAATATNAVDIGSCGCLPGLTATLLLTTVNISNSCHHCWCCKLQT